MVLVLILTVLSGTSALASNHATGVTAFSDVSIDHPDRGHILFLAQKGLINGYPDGRFGPADSLTRAAAAKIATQVAGLAPLSQGAALDFSDVPAAHWGVPFIRSGVENRLILGFEDGTFRPDMAVTRAELAALAIRATRQSRDRVPNIPVNDVTAADWFQIDALLAVAAGLMELTDGNFRPNEIATRGEAARAFAQAMVFTPLAFATPLQVMVEVDRGQVEVQQPDTDTWAPLTASTHLLEGGRVRTSGASAAKINFPDGSLIYLEAESEMILNRVRGAEMVSTIGVEELDVELVRGKLMTALAPRLSAEEAEAFAPVIARYLDKDADLLAAEVMAPRVRAASSHSGENLPSNATRLLIFVDPGSLEPGEMADVTIVMANEAGEPVTATDGPVTLEVLSDVGELSNSSPVIPQGFQAVTVKVTAPDAEPNDAKTRITAVAGEVSTSTTVPTSKSNWWSGLFKKKTRAVVRMPWSVASIRGTNALASAGAGENGFSVLNGNGTLTSTATGTTQEVNDLQEVGTSGPDEPVGAANPLSSQTQQAFNSNSNILQQAATNQTNAAGENLKKITEQAGQLAQQILNTLPPDTVDPDIAIDGQWSGFQSGQATVTVTGVANDNVALKGVSVNGSAASVSGTSWSATVNLVPGENSITAIATDTSDRTASASVTMQYDAENPSVSLTAPPTSKEPQITLTGSVRAPGGLASFTINGNSVSLQGNPITGASFSVTADLEQGSNAFDAVLKDNLGREASATTEVILATAPPSLSLDGGATTVGKVNYSVTGRAVPQFTKLTSVTLNGSSVLFSTNPSDYGAFAGLVKLKLGDNEISVTATDDAGNTTTESRTVVLDAAIPTIRIVQPTAESYFPATTTEATARVTFTAPLGVTSVTINGVDITPTGPAATAQALVPLVPGENLISAKLIDAGGREASDEIRVFQVVKPPTVSISLPEEGKRASKATIEVEATAAASVGPLASITANGSPMVLQNGRYRASVTLQSGSNTVTVAAVDKAGNRASDSRSVTYNPLAATVALSTPTNKLITKESTIGVSGTVANGEGIESILINNSITAPISGGSFSAQVPLTPGVNTITASLPVDAGGASEVRTVTYANRPPSLTVSKPTDGASVPEQNVTVSGSATTSYGTAAIVRVNGITANSPSASGFQASVRLVRGENSITISATDGAGNVTTETRTVTFQPALPNISLTSPTDGQVVKEASIQVTGAVSTRVGLEFVDVNGAGATFSASGGPFSSTVELKPGPNTITVTARDTVGGTSSRSVNVIRTGLPPTVSFASPSPGFISGEANLKVQLNASSQVGAIRSVTVNGSGASLVGGTWETTVPLTAGLNTLTAEVVTEYGDRASATTSVTFAQGVPTLEISGPADNTVVTTPTVNVAGTAQATTQTITVTVNGQVVSTSNGSFQATVSLSSGENTITVVATDTLNRSTTLTRTVILANTPPTISIASPTAQSTVQQPRVTVSGTMTVPKGVNVTNVSVNGVSLGAGANFSTEVTLLNLGANTITVTGTDSLNRTVTSSVTVNWTPPPLQANVSAPATSTAERVAVTGSFNGALGSASVQINNTAAVVSGTSYSAEVTLVPGANPISAVVTDSRGRTATATATTTFNPTPPTLTLSGPATNVTTQVATVSGTASSIYGPVTVVVGGQTFNLPTGGSFSATVDLILGTNNITATATAKFGSTTQSVTIFRVNPVPASPTISLAAPTAGASIGSPVTVSGSFTAAAALSPTARISVNGTIIPASAITANATNTEGTFTYSMEMLSSGAQTITAMVTDSLNRIDTATVNVTVAPTPITIDPIANPVVKASPIVLTGTAAKGASLVAVIDGVVSDTLTTTANDTGSFSLSVPLATDGAFLIAVRDSARNHTSSPVTVSLDRIIPHLELNSIAVTGNELGLSGSYIESHPKDLFVQIATGTTPVFDTPSESDRIDLGTTPPNTGTFARTLAGSQPGNYTLRVTMIDQAGNTTSIDLNALVESAVTEPRLRLVPKSFPSSAPVGSAIVIDVIMDNPPANLGGVTFELNYDKNLLSLDQGDIALGTLLDSPLSITNVDNATGKMYVNIASAIGPVSGQSLVATLTFTVVANTEDNARTMIAFADVTGLTGNGVLFLDNGSLGQEIQTSAGSIGTAIELRP